MWRCQWGNQEPKLEEGWAKRAMATIKRTKGQTTIYKITHKTKDRVKGTPPTTGIELIAPEE